MPTYVYQCTKCKEKWEEIHPVSDIDLPLSEPCISCDAQGDLGTNVIVRVPTFANLAKATGGMKQLSKGKMDPEVKSRIEAIKNRSDIAPETSKIDF